MPFVPHTEQDVQQMLEEIGVECIEALFDEIPPDLRTCDLSQLPAGISEMELGRLMKERAETDGHLLCFLGAGAYEHHIPAAVWDITSRGEFLTAYTPYQAEASQGTLQVLYEYQSMMSSLMGLAVSNASLYEGASSLAEAILMAVRLYHGHAAPRILLPRTVHPNYRRVVQTIVGQQGIEIVEIPYDLTTGLTSISLLNEYAATPFTALVIPQPNFFGGLEAVDEMTDWAHNHRAYVIGVVNPLAMALLKPPGQWGRQGADIACGEGQPLGVPLASGGPYYGFLCCKKEYVRQLPGRIVGETVDQTGQRGFVLTLQAREQHIRRAKATSNICTNQGLLVTASTLYMSLLGPQGLKQTAAACHARLMALQEALKPISQVRVRFTSPTFHECVLELPVAVDGVLRALAERKIQGGIDLSPYYPELEKCLLVCVTETKTDSDLNLFAKYLEQTLAQCVLNQSVSPRSFMSLPSFMNPARLSPISC